jgi:hypothetical protein
MANQIVQRLIAAGASPQRASQFATQFQQSLPGSKPREIQDAFDEEIAALSKAFYPNTFRPPTMESPWFIDYAIGVFGEDAISAVVNNNFAKYAPTFIKAQNGSDYEQKLVKLIKEDGLSLAQLNKQFQDDLFNSVDTGFNSKDGEKYIAKLFGEYSKANNLSLSGVNTFLNKDKFYKAGLPDPKLKYGQEEDLSAGIISWKTHPQVEKYLNTPEFKAKSLELQPKIKSIASGKLGGYDYGNDPRMTADMNEKAALQNTAAYNKVVAETKDFDENYLFKQFSTSKANPFKDEVIRRESLKKKTLLK